MFAKLNSEQVAEIVGETPALLATWRARNLVSFGEYVGRIWLYSPEDIFRLGIVVELARRNIPIGDAFKISKTEGVDEAIRLRMSGDDSGRNWLIIRHVSYSRDGKSYVDLSRDRENRVDDYGVALTCGLRDKDNPFLEYSPNVYVPMKLIGNPGIPDDLMRCSPIMLLIDLDDIWGTIQMGRHNMLMKAR